MTKRVQKTRARVDFHIKIKPELKTAFKELVEEMGFSTCFIIETLIQAYLAGAPAPQKAHPGSSLMINQKIDYVVERPRRVKGFRTPLENCYFNGCWTYRKPEEKESLSSLGHVAECECSTCKPFVSLIRAPKT